MNSIRWVLLLRAVDKYYELCDLSSKVKGRTLDATKDRSGSLYGRRQKKRTRSARTIHQLKTNPKRKLQPKLN